MKNKKIIFISALLLFVIPFLGIPNDFQDILISIFSLVILFILIAPENNSREQISPESETKAEEKTEQSYSYDQEETYQQENSDQEFSEEIKKESSEESEDDRL